MSDSYSDERDERGARRLDRQSERLTEQEVSAPQDSLVYPATLLRDDRLHTRGSRAVRATVMQSAQETHGNRAVQRSVHSGSAATPEGGPLGEEIGQHIEQRRGAGSPLPAHARAEMERAFGASLEGVRVHTDEESDALNRTLGARAFTTGSDIFFRAGAGPEDSRLLSHELTHVLQQRGSGETAPAAVGAEGSSQEQEADQVATAVVAGGEAHVSPSPSAAGSVARDLFDGLQVGDWKILPPTFKGSTDDRYDTPENRRRAEMKDQDKRSNDPSPPKWWETPKYDPSAPLPWMPKIDQPQQGPMPLPPIPQVPDDRGDYPVPPQLDDEDEQYA